MGDWTALGCDLARTPAERLGAQVARWCYARVRAPDRGVALVLAYTDDWRVAEAQAYSY